MTSLVKIFTLLTLVFCHFSQAKERPEATGRMREVFNSLMNLQTYIVSEERFRDPKNRSVIEKDLKTLNQVKHAFPKKMLDEEPGLAEIGRAHV